MNKELIVNVRDYCPALKSMGPLSSPDQNYTIRYDLGRGKDDPMQAGKTSLVCYTGEDAVAQENNEEFEGGLLPHLVFDEVDSYVPRPEQMRLSCWGCPLLPDGFDTKLIRTLSFPHYPSESEI
jgi:hypothetical protein